jgi:hypothetical protein
MQKTGTNQRSLPNRGVVAVSQWLAQTSYTVYFTAREVGVDSSIVVYQMGKVGSTTITETLRKLQLNQPIYHVHHLTKDGLRIEELNASRRQRPALRQQHYWTGRYLRAQLIAKARDDWRWYVVTLTRDPVARNLSGFFHSMRNSHPKLFDQLGTTGEDELFPEIKAAFLHHHPHDRPLDWLDVELKNAFGIDVYDQPFPWSKGCSIIQSGNVRLLILRLENFSSCIHEAFEDWLERPFDEVNVVSANRAEGKPYLNHYRNFQKWIVLPDEYLCRMYDSKFARHFYSPDELDGFRQRWSGQVRHR